MALVGAARTTGNGQGLMPPGCDSILDIPWDLARAIEHASRILGWRENVMPDDMPPDWMLPFDDELVEWFDMIAARRESENGGDDEGPMERNELAAEWRS